MRERNVELVAQRNSYILFSAKLVHCKSMCVVLASEKLFLALVAHLCRFKSRHSKQLNMLLHMLATPFNTIERDE